MGAFDMVKSRLFGVSDREASFEIRGFHCPDSRLKEHLEKVGIQFLYGYHKALLSGTQINLVSQLESVQPQYKGFAYEGAAMAMTLLDYLSPFRKDRLRNFMDVHGGNHTYMLYVGAGWALARLPFHPERSLHKFHPVYKWLAIDGYGFHQAYFKTDKYVHAAYLPGNLSGYSLHAFYQGVGRALWFVLGGQPEQIANQIKKYPEQYHGDLWSGIGLACTYAGIVDPSVIVEVKSLGMKYRYYLSQGAVFASKARSRAGNRTPFTEQSLWILAGVDADTASKIADDTLLDVQDSNGLPAFEIWREKIRDEIRSRQNIQTQKTNTDEKILS